MIEVKDRSQRNFDMAEFIAENNFLNAAIPTFFCAIATEHVMVAFVPRWDVFL